MISPIVEIESKSPHCEEEGVIAGDGGDDDVSVDMEVEDKREEGGNDDVISIADVNLLFLSAHIIIISDNRNI